MPWMDNNGCSLNATEMIWKGKMFSEDRGPPSVQDELVSQQPLENVKHPPPNSTLAICSSKSCSMVGGLLNSTCSDGGGEINFLFPSVLGEATGLHFLQEYLEKI